MACGGCGKNRRPSRAAVNNKTNYYNFTGGVDVKSLNQKQINARLEIFKRRFCSDCNDRYKCNYEVFLNCKGEK